MCNLSELLIFVIISFSFIKGDQTADTQWASRMDGDKNDRANNAAFDSNGNLLVVGHFFSSNISVFNSSGIIYQNLTQNGLSGVFISKYDSNGDLIWINQMTGSGDETAYGVSIDQEDNIAVVGRYSSSAFLIYDQSVNSPQRLKSNGSTGGYLVKYNKDGVYIWSSRMDGPGYDFATVVDFNQNGDIVVCGGYSLQPLKIFDAQDIFITELPINGSQGAFVVQYFSNGSCGWSSRIDGSGLDRANSVVFDKLDNVIVAGEFSSSQAIVYDNTGSVVHSLTSTGLSGGFLVKFTGNGQFIWAAKIDGSGEDKIFGLDVDSNNNIYVSGYYNSATVQIHDKYDINVLNINLTGYEGAFLVQYNASGLVTNGVSININGSTKSLGIAVDILDEVVLSGFYQGTNLAVYDVNGFLKGSRNQQLSYGAYVIKFKPGFEVNWILRIEASNQIVSYVPAVSKQGQISLVGGYTNTTLDVYDSSGNNSLSLPYAVEQAIYVITFTEVLAINETSLIQQKTSSSVQSIIQSISISSSISSLGQTINLTSQSITSLSSTFQYNFSSSLVLSDSSIFSQVSSLSNNNQTQNFEFNNFYLQILLASVGVVVFIILVIILFIHFKIKKKKQKQVNDNSSSLVTFTETEAFSSLTTALVTQNPLSIPLFLEQQFGVDFRTSTLIAEGGLGLVYKGQIVSSQLQSRVNGNEVVIKVLKNSENGLQGQIKLSFFQEVSLYYKFRNTGLFAEIYAYSSVPAAIVLKYYSVGSLKPFVLSNQLSGKFNYNIRQINYILYQLNLGILQLHNSGFAHLDIKADNILLDFDDHIQLLSPKITDFGISKLVDLSQNLVKAFQVSKLRGLTLNYASPELIKNFRKQLTINDESTLKKSDVYSISLLIFEMLTRRNVWSSQ